MDPKTKLESILPTWSFTDRTLTNYEHSLLASPPKIDGYTPALALRDLDAAVKQVGWFVLGWSTGIEGWTYTVGVRL